MPSAALAHENYTLGFIPQRASTGIEASTPIANFTLGQATRYIIAGISAESAGTNCTIWVDEGIQCGGQASPLLNSAKNLLAALQELLFLGDVEAECVAKAIITLGQ